MTNQKLAAEERILDAAERCFEQFGIAKTTIRDVAEAAGVSHMTIYRKFGDRDELFTATSLRLLDRRWAGIADELSDIDKLSEWLLEALLANWRLIQAEQTHLRYGRTGAVEKGMSVGLSDPGLACLTRHFEHMVSGSGRKKEERVLDIAEWLHWMSYVMASDKSRRLRSENSWRRWLAPQIAGGFTASPGNQLVGGGV